MIHINFNPLNNLTSHKTVIYPIAPGELWLVDLHSQQIQSIITQTILDKKDDDQGLYYRLREGLTKPFRDYTQYIKAQYMLIGCSLQQDEAPSCSNIFCVYDMYTKEGLVIDLHLAEKCCRLSDFSRPPYLVRSIQKALDIYLSEEDILFWGHSKFPRPTMLRAYQSDQPLYKLLDPYLQWSPPRFWYQTDRMHSIPANLEGWIQNIVESFNWDYFYHLIHNEGHPLASVEHLIAALFDIIYDEYLYYGICKKLFTDEHLSDMHPQLLGSTQIQVLVNFTDIVDTIRKTLYYKLKQEESKSDITVKREEVDKDLLTAAFNDMFEQIGVKA